MIDKKTIKQFLYYIKGKLHYGLYYSPFDNFKLVGYMDIYWGKDLDDKKSTNGVFFLFFLLGDTAIT